MFGFDKLMLLDTALAKNKGILKIIKRLPQKMENDIKDFFYQEREITHVINTLLAAFTNPNCRYGDLCQDNVFFFVDYGVEKLGLNERRLLDEYKRQWTRHIKFEESSTLKKILCNSCRSYARWGYIPPLELIRNVPPRDTETALGLNSVHKDNIRRICYHLSI